jgi:glyoxylase-like metal-dependent hydrolase (beta-lactamase superfamily II)
VGVAHGMPTGDMCHIAGNGVDVKAIPVSSKVGTESHQVIHVGSGVKITLIYTPGHTPGSQCFLVQKRLVAGDTLFIGTCGRVDLPNSSPEDMYDSLTNKLMRLDDDTVLYPGHNYAMRSTSSIGEERRTNRYVQPASLMQFLRMMGY